MLRAIEETTIEGVATTLPADVVILTDEQFVNGTHSTNWVESELDFSSLPEVATAAVSVGDGQRAQGRHRRGQRTAGHRRAVGAGVRRRTAPRPRAPRANRVASTTPACWAAARPTSSSRCRGRSSR